MYNLSVSCFAKYHCFQDNIERPQFCKYFNRFRIVFKWKIVYMELLPQAGCVHLSGTLLKPTMLLVLLTRLFHFAGHLWKSHIIAVALGIEPIVHSKMIIMKKLVFFSAALIFGSLLSAQTIIGQSAYDVLLPKHPPVPVDHRPTPAASELPFQCEVGDVTSALAFLQKRFVSWSRWHSSSTHTGYGPSLWVPADHRSRRLC